MPSGYEKTPDYGGPEPGGWGDLVLAAICLAAAALFVWILVR